MVVTSGSPAQAFHPRTGPVGNQGRGRGVACSGSHYCAGRGTSSQEHTFTGWRRAGRRSSQVLPAHLGEWPSRKPELSMGQVDSASQGTYDNV